jgi:hypothetical protein
VKLQHLIDRLQAQPGVASVGIVLVLITLIGLLAAKPLSGSLLRAFLYDIVLIGWAFFWVRVNHPLEGRTLLPVTYNHGLTLADMLGLPAVILAFGLFIAALARRPERPRSNRLRSPGGPSTGPCIH